MLKSIIKFFRPSIFKIGCLFSVFIGLQVLKYAIVFILLGTKSLIPLIEVPLLFLLKFSTLGYEFVSWLDSMFWVTDKTGSIIYRPQIIITFLKYRLVFDFIWSYLVTCFLLFIIEHFDQKEVASQEVNSNKSSL